MLGEVWIAFISDSMLKRRLAGAMSMDDTISGSDLLNDLAEQFAERYRGGERPSLSEYTDRYPELAEEIRELFPALVMMEQLGRKVGARRISISKQAQYRAGTRRVLDHHQSRHRITALPKASAR